MSESIKPKVKEALQAELSAWEFFMHKLQNLEKRIESLEKKE